MKKTNDRAPEDFGLTDGNLQHDNYSFAKVSYREIFLCKIKVAY
jgi:hypothetical protein